jgi:hypothetical protein
MNDLLFIALAKAESLKADLKKILDEAPSGLDVGYLDNQYHDMIIVKDAIETFSKSYNSYVNSGKYALDCREGEILRQADARG